MITPFIFAQLLKNPSKNEFYFNDFINKYKNKFESTIAIRFAADKYHDVKINNIFYTDFKAFVIQDLESVKDNVCFEDWVFDLAERRVKKIRSEVDKETARVLTQKGGIKNWMDANDIISREHINTINKVVLTCFKDDKYQDCKKDISSILLNLFYLERATNPTPIAHIDNYEGWLFKCLSNLANNKRKDIEKELGIRDGSIISLDNLENSKKNKAKNASTDDFSEKSNNITHQPTDTNSFEKATESKSKNEDDSYPIDDIVDSSYDEGAEVELEKYLTLMSPWPKYVELIRAIKLEGIPAKTLAEEWGCTNAAIYNMMNEAMAKLVSVALPEIRFRMKKTYKKCITSNNTEIKFSKFEKTILKELFEDGLKLVEIATKHDKSPSYLSNMFYAAINKVKRISNRFEMEEYLTDEEEREFKKQISWD